MTPYTDAIKMNPTVPVGSPIPRVVGGSSPIKHVFYIIRENRTYDSILGDMKQGNGDPALTLFGAAITPNAHALASQFVLFDNFYVDADVSYDGHAFSTAAYATDVIQKLWQTYYANRGGVYLSEGSGFMRNAVRQPVGARVAATSGTTPQRARRQRPQLRRVRRRTAPSPPPATCVAIESVPGLKNLVAPAFAGFDLTITDQKRVDTWLQEFNGFVQNGNLPQLSILHLGNDHTQGTTPGAPTPRAMIADNDLALGPRRRSDCEQPLLEGLRDLHRRGRCAERSGSRGLAPLGGAGGEPVREARLRGPHVLFHVGHAAIDGADSRPAADEHLRRGGDADVQRVSGDARSVGLPAAHAERRARREEPGDGRSAPPPRAR